MCPYRQAALTLVRDGGALAGTLLIYFLIPPGKKPDLNSTLGLIVVALLFLSAFLVDSSINSSLVLAFYLIFPLAAVSINSKNGILISLALGLVLVIINSVPGIQNHIHLKLFETIIFMVCYLMIIAISHHIERIKPPAAGKAERFPKPVQGAAGREEMSLCQNSPIS